MKNLSNFVAHSILDGGRTRLYAAGIFYACTLQIICGSVPPCGALMRPLPSRWNATGQAEPFFIFLPDKQLSVMHSTEKNCLTVNNSICPATSAHETCTQFFAFIKANYPQIKYLKFKQSGKWYIFRGQWKRRKMYSHGYSPEYAMSRFLLEILRKVFTERLMTPEEYHARRAELRRCVMMNYPVYELPKNVVV